LITLSAFKRNIIVPEATLQSGVALFDELSVFRFQEIQVIDKKILKQVANDIKDVNLL